MNTFSTILAAAQRDISEANGETEATQAALIELVVNLTNDATKCGALTSNRHYPKHQTYWSTLYVYLREAGFDLLGQGFFSLAVSHAALPERVLKVGLKKEDSAAAYTAWCRMNQGKVGVPNVHATKRSTGCYVVVLDELYPLDTEKLAEWKGYCTAAAGVHGWVCEYPDDEALSALHATALSIREFFKGLADFDMHEGNVMVDSKGNVIITDPVSYTKGVSEGSSWALMDNEAAINELKREQIAERARQRHQRNQERQELRKAQKARNKERKALAAKVPVIMWNKGESMVVGGSLPNSFGGFIAPNIVQPDPAKVEAVMLKIRQQFEPKLMDIPKRIEWDPREPLGDKLSRMRKAMLEAHKLEAAVVNQIEGLDAALDAEFLRG